MANKDALYKWEKGVNATWETVMEDEQGRLISYANSERERSHRAKRARITQSIRRGLIRFLIVALDCSNQALEKDYRPSRLMVCKSHIKQFIYDYYDQNPISQLSLVVTRDRIADKITDLSANAKNHIHRLDNVMQANGLASLQNILILSISLLKYIPLYGSREVLIIYNSLSTCDPSNIFETIEQVKAHNIKVHIVCIAAELYICKQIAEMTGGLFYLALNEEHLQEIIASFTVPMPAQAATTESATSNGQTIGVAVDQTDFIYMGFPKRSFDPYLGYAYDGKQIQLSANTFICPRCVTRTTDIPTQCAVCRLQLYSSSHIARSFHHLFPVPTFKEYTVSVVEAVEEAVSDSVLMQLRTDPISLQYYAMPYLLNDNSAVESGDASSRPEYSNPSSVKVEIATQEPTSPKPRTVEERQTREELMSASMEFGTPPPPPPPDEDDDGDAPPPPPPEDEESDQMGVDIVEKPASDGRIRLQKDQFRCRGCFHRIAVNEKIIFACPNCSSFFCVDCDLFIHDSLHNCPGCPI